MHRKLKHFILLTALVAVTSLAWAEDPPARVARVSVVEGQVTVQDPGSDEAGGNLVNWPVTSGTRVTAAPGARTELRVGSTAVRLDGDSSMEVIELDDNVLRLRLDYGTASVRLRSPDQAAGFELETPQGRVTMAEPGLVRVDAERMPDTTVVTMLAGSGRIDGAGTSMNLRSGKMAEVRGDDVRTGLAQRTSFDDWVLARDRRDENSPSLRYVTADVTGYEELDANGTWREDPDYGPLWIPRAVPVDWAPYRDGRWTWLEPWGWTWVDNAPWGYAPSHYGRWVFVQSRWCWAPGRTVVRPAWAPALVGWVGGNDWNVTFRDRRAGPGVGWYPLTPRDQYVPNYRVSVETQRRLEWQHAGRVQWRERDPRTEVRREGVTVLPREYFERRSIVNVSREPRVTLAPGDVRKAPLITAPPAAPVQVNRPGRVIETRREDWRERSSERRNDAQRPLVGQPFQGQPQRVIPGQPLVQQPGIVQEERRRDERGRITQPQQLQQLQQGAPGTLVRNPQQDAQRQAQEQQRQEQFRQERQRPDLQRQAQQRDEQQRQEQFRQDQQRQVQQRDEQQRQEQFRQDQQRQVQQREEQQRQEQFRQERQRQEQFRQDQQRQVQQRDEQLRQDQFRQAQQREERQRQEQFRQDQQRQEQQRQEQQRQALQAQQAQQEQQRQAQQREEQQRQMQQAQQREAQLRQEQQRQAQEQQRQQFQQAQQREEQQRREQREAMRQERQQGPQAQPQPQQGPRPAPPAAERRQREQDKDGRRKAQE